MSEYRKKLIEVALPLEAINRESAREKSIRHGHPSTLHLWWARRPLAACRAMIFASLVDDPSSHPEKYPTDELQDAERQRLFGIIEDLVKWENTTNETVLDAARREVLSSTGGDAPPVLDPFCGGGSIPLEAQRLGLDAMASDLNPVAVLINKVLVEFPPRFAGRPPVNPRSHGQLDTGQWHGARGLAEDVEYYGNWMHREAEAAVGHLYPRVRLPASLGGGEAAVIAWFWARTARCPNPACGAEMPLLNSLVLSRRRGHEATLVPVVDQDARTVDFDVQFGPCSHVDGTVGRNGARCLVCETNVPLAEIRSQGCSRGLGERLVAVVAEGPRGRAYVRATPEHVEAARVEAPADLLNTPLPEAALGFRVQGYGITRHSQLFTARQRVVLDMYSSLVAKAAERARKDGASDEYAAAIAAALVLSIGRLANRSSSQSFWNPNGEKVEQVFARNALPMIWVFAEGNPFSDSSGNYRGQLAYLTNALGGVPACGRGVVEQRDARAIDLGRPAHVVTDPPYYDNVPYADLSDFFYVWLRHAGQSFFPDLFSTLLVPKSQELIAEPARQGSPRAAREYFEEGLAEVFGRMRDVQSPDAPAVLFYAFKQSEDESGTGGRSSTGWDTLLSALIRSGFMVTATWPVRTELHGGLREHGRNSLASSIAVACRNRPANAPISTRREFLGLLRAELPAALKSLQHGNIAPVDLAQAAIGPGIGIFSRHAKVMEADGSSMTVRTALSLINQALDEIFVEQEGEFDPDTRWAIAWFEQFGTEPGEYGVAETLSKAKVTSVEGMVRAGIVEARSGRGVRLLRREELQKGWDPASDDRLTVWEMTQHLVSRLDDERSAAALVRQLGPYAEVARDLAYRLYLVCERKGWSQEGQAYNGLVVAWPEIMRLSLDESMGEAQGGLF